MPTRASRAGCFPTHAWWPTSFTSCGCSTPLDPPPRRGHRRPTLDDHPPLAPAQRPRPRLLAATRRATRFLDHYPALREVYLAKEALHRLYRTRGYSLAHDAPSTRCSRVSRPRPFPSWPPCDGPSQWRHEVLAYFDTGLTNAITGGLQPQGKARTTQSFRLQVLPKLSTATPKRVCLSGPVKLRPLSSEKSPLE